MEIRYLCNNIAQFSLNPRRIIGLLVASVSALIELLEYGILNDDFLGRGGRPG
jgi:hypothetical protein